MKRESKIIVHTHLRAGIFSTWLRNIRKALSEKHGMVVPCGECVACCSSSYFIHIQADETRTLNNIPKKLLFPAPLRPKGSMVLGYNKYGHCPMLLEHKCSIYRNRPFTCRSFDCRILAASGIETDNTVDNLVFQQSRRWQFSFPTKNDHNLFLAVQSAAKYLTRHPDCIKDIFINKDEIQLSVLAIKVYDVFLGFKGAITGTTRDSEISKRILYSFEKFEKQMNAA